MADFREGQRVRVRNVIHRSQGSAWPGDIGTVERIADPGPAPKEITVRFGGFTATAVYAGDLEPA